MIHARIFPLALMAAAVLATAAAAQTPMPGDRALLAEFARRVQAYTDVRDRAAAGVLPLRPLADPGEVRRRTDALAAAIESARQDARQGDIFSPAIAQLIRRAVRAGCDDNLAQLLALVNEELEKPLPDPVIHLRWPAGAPLPTMMPDLLAALPPLPPNLQYRFMNRALVLLDIDANLVVDFVPGVIPVVTTSSAFTARWPHPRPDR